MAKRWSLAKHEKGSPYGAGAYTLWPAGRPHAIIIGEGLTRREAALIEAAPDLARAVRGLLGLGLSVELPEVRRARAALEKAGRRAP